MDDNDNASTGVPVSEPYSEPSARAGSPYATAYPGLQYQSQIAAAPLSQPYIRVVTVETRRAESSFPVPGAIGLEFKNIGANKAWQGLQTKTMLYLDWVRTFALQAPEELVILADGGDMGWGGCSVEDLVSRYTRMIEAVPGARVVVGADMHVWPPFLQDQPPVLAEYSRLEQFRLASLGAFGMGANAYGGAYKYANSGFLLGPAAELVTLLECILQRGTVPNPAWPHFDDQFGLTMCLFGDSDNLQAFPLVALDYSGTIVADMFGLSSNLLRGESGSIYNTEASAVQCFIHGNAGSLPPEQLSTLAGR